MKAVSTKPRRSMRVATVFTGIAACTAGVTQVANAQDARPMGRASGSIREYTECGIHGVDPYMERYSKPGYPIQSCA